MLTTRQLTSKQPTFVFIDATNIIDGASRAGWKVDFEKLIKYLRARHQAQLVFYYAGVDHRNLKQLGFYRRI